MVRLSLALLVLGLLALAGATRGAPGQGHGRTLLQLDTSASGNSAGSTQPGESDSSTSPTTATIANATTTESLFEALLSPSVTTIRLLGELVVNPDRARAVVMTSLGAQTGALNLTRDVTIVGVPINTSIATLDFNFTARLVHVATGATLNFLRIRVRGLFERLDTAPVLFTNTSSGSVRFTNTILQRTACLPPTQQLVELINANRVGGTNASGTGGTGGGGDGVGSTSLVTSGAAPTIIAGDGTGASPGSGDGADSGNGYNSFDIAPAYVYDQPFCVSTLTDVGLDPLAVDDCFTGPLVLQDITIIVSSSTGASECGG